MSDHRVAGGHAGHPPSSGAGMAISAWLTGIYFAIELGIGLAEEIDITTTLHTSPG